MTASIFFSCALRRGRSSAFSIVLVDDCVEEEGERRTQDELTVIDFVSCSPDNWQLDTKNHRSLS